MIYINKKNQKDNFCALKQFNTIETTWKKHERKPEAADILDPT